MTKTTLQQLADYGQSAWLDYISRPLLESGKLKNLIAQGLRGMTSNPSIFNQAISSSNDYDSKIMRLKGRGKSSFEIYDALTIADIQDATDQFKSGYTATKGGNVDVSLGIIPTIAYNTNDRVPNALRLSKGAARPNLRHRVPATPE